MTNKKRKGFTIVELVIVIAVIAILAGVLIPTFTSIIDKANQSTDIQAVRQMNVMLKAESVDKTLEFNDVIEIVSKVGYDTKEKRTPKSANHGFYWHAAENIILLAKDKEGETPVLVYPIDNDALKTALEDGLSEENGFYTLEVEGGGSVKEINSATTNLAGLIAGGGNFKLTGSITISEPITISSDVTIDLNSNDLTLDAKSENYFQEAIGVYGNVSLTIKDTKDGGSLIINASETNGFGIYVDGINEDGTLYKGKLNLNGVNIEGNRARNIYSQGGEINLTDTIYTINYGYGIYNAGTTTITGGEFIAAGGYVCSVYNESETMTISSTKFIEAKDVVVSYMYYAPIEAMGGKLNLNNVNVTTDDTSDNNVYCGGGAVNITGGLFNGKFFTIGNSSYIYIRGDTKYNENDCFEDTDSISFKQICCVGYGGKIPVSVIKCTYENVTTFIIYQGLYAFDALAGIAGFEGDNGLIIPKGSEVVLDNSPELIESRRVKLPETILTQDMAIYGTLKINGGYLFAGDEVVTIKEAKALEDGTKVEISGTVKSIDTEWSDQYGNITITLEDATGSFQCYCLATKVEEGDKITVTGVVGSYNGTKQIAAGATAEKGDASIMNITVYNGGEFHLDAEKCMRNKGDSQSTSLIYNEGYINNKEFVTIKDGGQVYINGSDTAYTPS